MKKLSFLLAALCIHTTSGGQLQSTQGGTLSAEIVILDLEIPIDENDTVTGKAPCSLLERIRRNFSNRIEKLPDLITLQEAALLRVFQQPERVYELYASDNETKLPWSLQTKEQHKKLKNEEKRRARIKKENSTYLYNFLKDLQKNPDKILETCPWLCMQLSRNPDACIHKIIKDEREGANLLYIQEALEEEDPQSPSLTHDDSPVDWQQKEIELIEDALAEIENRKRAQSE